MWMPGKRPDGTVEPPTPRKRPVVIKNGAFVARLYDIGGLMELPLVNVRKLWKLMLDETLSNEDTIIAIQGWLPQAINAERDRLQHLGEELLTAKKDAESKRQTVTQADRDRTRLLSG